MVLYLGSWSLSAEGTFIVRGSLHLDFSTWSHMSHAHHHHHGEYDNEGGGLEVDHISKLGLVAEIAIAGGKGYYFNTIMYVFMLDFDCFKCY